MVGLLVTVLQAGLESNFAEAQVNVVECPDLTQKPFCFPVPGKSILLFKSLNSDVKQSAAAEERHLLKKYTASICPP